MVFRLKTINFVNVRFFELLTKTETLDVVQMSHDVLPRWIDPLLFQIGNLGFHLQKNHERLMGIKYLLLMRQMKTNLFTMIISWRSPLSLFCLSIAASVMGIILSPG